MLACIPHLRAFARVLTNDAERADDLVELTLVRARIGLLPVPLENSLQSWLFTIMHILHFGEAARVARPARAVAPATAPAPRAANDSAGHLADFRRAFWQLRDEQREVLMLDAASRLSSRDIASVLGGSAGRFQARLTLAQEKLLQILHDAASAHMPAATRHFRNDGLPASAAANLA